MEKDQNLYCAWADAGLALHNSGRCLLCCHSQTYLQDNTGNEIYLDSGTIEQAWTSPTRQEIQTALSRGEQHPNCSACWNEEAAGRQSRRQVANEQFQDMTVTGVRPQLVDLKPGNTCNLACRSCWPEVSSKWYRDYWEIEAHKHHTDYNEYLRSWSRIRTSYDRDNQGLWQDLEHWFQDVEYYDIYGAEPMLLDRVFEILGQSVASSRCQTQKLHINTNGTIWNDDYIRMLTQFQRVNIDISIDGIGDRFGYIRYGETWPVIEANLDRYQQLARDHSNIDLHVCVTVTSLNVLDVIDIQHYFCDRRMAVFYNMVHHPQHLNVRSLPTEVKAQVRQRLQQQRPNWQIDSIMDFMDMPLEDQPRLWQRFCESTAQLDALRKQDIRTTLPELWQIIEPYWINQ